MSEHTLYTPLPRGMGYGFSTRQPLSEEGAKGYRYEQAGIYHNYYFTTKRFQWPVRVKLLLGQDKFLDGISPNLNKKLHAGHLKQLAVASSLAQIVPMMPVAMLGAAVGVIDGALQEFADWCQLAKYDLTDDTYVLDTDLEPYSGPGIYDGTGEYAGCKVMNGKLGPVVLFRSKDDKYGTYAAHDLSFMQHELAPDVYLTGAEQREHFENLGLGDKHKPMGLLLGPDGTKMKSRTGDAVLASELFEQVRAALRSATKEDKKVAWNILAWNFNAARVSRDTKFELSRWADPNSPGLYITYTLARYTKALANTESPFPSEPTEAELPMLAWTAYSQNAIARARAEMEPCHIAQFAHELARFMGSVYEGNEARPNGAAPVKFRDSKGSRLYALHGLRTVLATVMSLLSMWPLDEV